MSMFDFLNLTIFQKERAEEALKKLLRDEFIYLLKQDNRLTIHPLSGLRSPSGQHIISKAVTMDRKRGSLIIAEKSPDGILILERNDPVTVVTQANQDHEVFSFHSKVSNIILDNGDILYEVVIPRRLEKSQRRTGYRVNIESQSQIKISNSVYGGEISNLSSKGLLFALDGYWPEPVESGESLVKCAIDMDFMQFNCHVEVRYINFEPYPGRRTYIGGQIKDLPSQQQHLLDNYLSAQQRIQQRQKAELKYV